MCRFRCVCVGLLLVCGVYGVLAAQPDAPGGPSDARLRPQPKVARVGSPAPPTVNWDAMDRTTRAREKARVRRQRARALQTPEQQLAQRAANAAAMAAARATQSPEEQLTQRAANAAAMAAARATQSPEEQQAQRAANAAAMAAARAAESPEQHDQRLQQAQQRMQALRHGNNALVKQFMEAPRCNCSVCHRQFYCSKNSGSRPRDQVCTMKGGGAATGVHAVVHDGKRRGGPTCMHACMHVCTYVCPLLQSPSLCITSVFLCPRWCRD